MSVQLNSVGLLPALNYERFMESCGEDAEFAREVLTEFLKVAPGTLERLGAAITASDARSVCSEAHSIKGSSRTIGAEAMAEVCQAMESLGKSENLTDAPAVYAQVEREYARLCAELNHYFQEKAA